MTIGEKILNLRKARGWSQEELAERIGVTRQAVSRWESDSAKPDADKIIAVCDLFGVSADYLLRDIAGGSAAPVAAEEKQGRISANQIIGLIFVCISVILTTVFAIYGSVYGGIHSEETVGGGYMRTYHGMMAVVKRYDMDWLLWLFAGIAVLGIYLLFQKQICRWICQYRKGKKK